jgi:hypothetical protein
VEAGARRAAAHHRDEPVAPRGERHRALRERRGRPVERAPLVEEHAVHADADGELRPDGEEVAASLPDRHVRREGEHVAVRRLALEREGAVGRGQGARRRGREARGGGHRRGDGAVLRRDLPAEVERVQERVRAGERPRRHGAVLGPVARGGGVVALHLRGGRADDPGAVGGGPGEPALLEELRDGQVDVGGARGSGLRELAEAAEGDDRERIARRRRDDGGEVARLGLAVEGAAGEKRGGERDGGVGGPSLHRGGGAAELRLGAVVIVLLDRAERGAGRRTRHAGARGPGAAEREGEGEERRGAARDGTASGDHRELSWMRAAEAGVAAAGGGAVARGSAGGAIRTRRAKARSMAETRPRNAG